MGAPKSSRRMETATYTMLRRRGQEGWPCTLAVGALLAGLAALLVLFRDDGRAEVEVSIDNDFGPLHAGSTATIRAARRSHGCGLSRRLTP